MIQILGLLGMYFDAVVVKVKTFSLLFRLALAILYIDYVEVGETKIDTVVAKNTPGDPMVPCIRELTTTTYLHRINASPIKNLGGYITLLHKCGHAKILHTIKAKVGLLLCD